MRALRCACGRRLEAANDEGLLARVRDHFGREHPEASLGEERLRWMVAHAFGLEYASVYGDGEGPDEEFGPEPY